MNPATINAIASAYERAAHVPEWEYMPRSEYERITRVSYSAFVAETIEQYAALVGDFGVKIIPTIGTLTGSSLEMFQRINRERALIVATEGAPFDVSHPLDRTQFETGLSLNVMFRAVHDYFGHYMTRAPFETFDGEIRAYRHHARMYSPVARGALFNETVAQLCYFYARGTFVPVQKACTLPDFQNEVSL